MSDLDQIWTKKTAPHLSLSGECAASATQTFAILCMSVSDHESTAGIDLGFTGDLNKFTNTEYANNKNQLFSEI